ncbi:MAG: IcmT/TraK family protein [Acetobacter sp.]|jgi:intracellular multiplication protein IcmT|nr:IcmT/TraK family protein [Acetobacter sp.]MCI1485824.1 IcmT/TraK family protein [Acetobacter sp.]MCI1529794.1 IcmT/TraK family protein [Acetobacter sp.]MCI1587537.1 IcmT/TraK family protein [Acetobacter sp.]MCI1601754.1 IcmT/TraK family protein [Acetobacter sp.]
MWRFTADPVRLLIIDARALAPFALWIAHMREWTLILAVIGVLFFSLLAWLGLTLPVAVRMLRVILCGPVRPRLSSWKKRDYA